MASDPSMESEDPDVNIRLDSEPDSSLTIADPVRPDAVIINIFKIYIIIDYSWGRRTFLYRILVLHHNT